MRKKKKRPREARVNWQKECSATEDLLQRTDVEKNKALNKVADLEMELKNSERRVDRLIHTIENLSNK